MSARQLVVVDVETTSLDVETAAVVEIAAINTATGEELHFVPWHTKGDINAADPEALEINGYHQRGLRQQMLDLGQTLEAVELLGEMLDGNTLGGANPRFDARVLEQLLARCRVLPGWHHRLADISAYTAGMLLLPPNELPGLAKCCDLLGVINEQEHSALADARATAACFEAAKAVAAGRDLNIEVRREIRFDDEGITIGGERVPGVIGEDTRVHRPGGPGELWETRVTFLSEREPITSPDVVNVNIDDTGYDVRPATSDDL